MFGTLAALAALAAAPAQAGTLNLTNVRTTYGELGAVRSDNRYLPGDRYHLSFDIEGLTVSPEGKVTYAMSVETKDKAGKSIFKQEKPFESEQLLPLGGNRMAGFAFVNLDDKQEPGTYTCVVTVIDRANKATKVLERSFDVVRREFGVIWLTVSYDPEAKMVAPPGGVVGQNLFVHGILVGIGRGADKKPNTTIEFRMYDEARKPTVSKPLTAVVPKELPEADDVAAIRFPLPLNREGTFTAEIKATDAATGKAATVSFPVRVLPQAK